MWRSFSGFSGFSGFSAFSGLSVIPGYMNQFFDIPYVESVQTQKKPKVVIVGSGWASDAFVRALDRSRYEVQVISERPERLNQPHMISLWKPTYSALPVPVTLDTCVSVETDKKKVVGKQGTYPYEYLVVATGSEPNDFGIPGVKEHCLTCKTDTDLGKIKGALKGREGESVTVLGAGPTGLELACKLSQKGHPVSVYEAAETVLPGFSPVFQTTVLRILLEKGIRMNLNQKIVGMTATSIRTREGEVADPALRIWTCGVRPTAFSRSLGKADSFQQLRPDVFAIGDCAGRPTAQSARQQGAYLATAFNTGFTEKKPFVYSELGRIIDLEDQFVVEINALGSVFVVPGFVRPLIHFATR